MPVLQRSHSSIHSKKPTCDHCGKRFSKNWLLQRHKRETHQICAVCLQPMKKGHICNLTCDRCELPINSVKGHNKDCIKLKCLYCRKHFDRRERVQLHEAVCQKNTEVHTCRKCDTVLPNFKELATHMKTCQKFPCVHCQGVFESQDELDDHKKEIHVKRDSQGYETRKKKPDMYRCRYVTINKSGDAVICRREFANKSLMMAHRLNVHVDPDYNLDWSEPKPWIENGAENTQLKEEMLSNRNYIFAGHSHSDLRSSFNFAFTGNNWKKELTEALDTARKAVKFDCVKVNACLGFILKDSNSGEYRYFTPGENFPLFTHPIRIDRFNDWDKVFDKATIEEAMSNVDKVRPNTKWNLVIVTNVVVHVFYLNCSMG